MDNNKKKTGVSETGSVPSPPEKSQVLNEEAEQYLKEPGAIEDYPDEEKVVEAEKQEKEKNSE